MDALHVSPDDESVAFLLSSTSFTMSTSSDSSELSLTRTVGAPIAQTFRTVRCILISSISESDSLSSVSVITTLDSLCLGPVLIPDPELESHSKLASVSEDEKSA